MAKKSVPQEPQKPEPKKTEPKKPEVKKAETKKVEPKSPPAKSAVAKAAEKIVEVVSHAAEAVNDHVIQPVAEAVGIVKKVKKPRFVREKKEKAKPQINAPLPERSKKVGGKMMTKNVTQTPKEETAGPMRKTKP